MVSECVENKGNNESHQRSNSTTLINNLGVNDFLELKSSLVALLNQDINLAEFHKKNTLEFLDRLTELDSTINKLKLVATVAFLLSDARKRESADAAAATSIGFAQQLEALILNNTASKDAIKLFLQLEEAASSFFLEAKGFIHFGPKTAEKQDAGSLFDQADLAGWLLFIKAQAKNLMNSTAAIKENLMLILAQLMHGKNSTDTKAEATVSANQSAMFTEASSKSLSEFQSRHSEEFVEGFSAPVSAKSFQG